MSMTTKPRSGLSADALRRLSGTALLAALPLQLAGFALHPAGEDLEHVVHAAYGPAHLVLFGSWILAALGLPALYSVQASRAGRLGLVAYIGTVTAVAYHLYLLLYEAAAIPVAARQAGASALVGDGGALSHGAGALGPFAGVLLLAFPALGIATLRAGVLPRAVGWLQIACVPVFLVLVLVIGAVNGGAVGPEAEHWVGGMLPIASLYWLLFTGWALGGRALRSASEPAGDDQVEQERRPRVGAAQRG